MIDTPMDFGTICDNLEKGQKYMNSKDVFKDVQCIWDNCTKYNKKGDYILELMKRVKMNFTKYWSAAGLYKEQPQATNGEDLTVLFLHSFFFKFFLAMLNGVKVDKITNFQK